MPSYNPSTNPVQQRIIALAFDYRYSTPEQEAIIRKSLASYGALTLNKTLKESFRQNGDFGSRDEATAYSIILEVLEELEDLEPETFEASVVKKLTQIIENYPRLTEPGDKTFCMCCAEAQEEIIEELSSLLKA